MQLTPILIGVLATLPAAAWATQTFANTGTTPEGWDSIQTEHDGTAQQATNVVYGTGGTAIKVTQTYDVSYTGRYHSELHHTEGYHLGEQGFYGFAFRYNLAQFIADFTYTGCDDWMPSSMVWIIGDQLASRVKTGSICSQAITEFKNLATVSAGVWHKVVIQANWQNDDTGYYKLWLDGVKVLEEQVWYDQIGMGTAFADADPDQWS
ncbi:polysaccharide lyase-domain-containing protein [Mycena sanguinolenta]|nr:polysaccharide lyase-domain-containing protein [Mycena sanguinolenta]